MRDTTWQDDMRAMFARRDRFEMFMGDHRAADAINCEAAVCVPGFASEMDTEDFMRMIQGRVDTHGQNRDVLRRFGII